MRFFFSSKEAFSLFISLSSFGGHANAVFVLAIESPSIHFLVLFSDFSTFYTYTEKQAQQSTNFCLPFDCQRGISVFFGLRFSWRLLQRSPCFHFISGCPKLTLKRLLSVLFFLQLFFLSLVLTDYFVLLFPFFPKELFTLLRLFQLWRSEVLFTHL